MQVRTSIGVLVSDPGRATYFEKAVTQDSLDTRVFTAASSDTFLLPGTGQQVGLSLGNVPAVRGLYLEADGPVELVLNGNAISLCPAEPGMSASICAEVAVFSLQLSASVAGTPVSGRYVVWGGEAEPA